MIRVAPVLIAIVLLLQLVPVAVPAVAPAKADEDGAGVVDDMGATGRAWDPWWNANWSYRKPIDVNNSINRFTLNEFQVPINLTWTNGMAADYRDIRFVRDFMEKEPWEAESWFYGEVQDTEERLVIKISVNSANQYIEVFVASSNLSSMTGLLAELSSDVMGKVKGEDLHGEELKVCTDEKFTEEVKRTRMLLEKYGDAEIGAEETEQK